MCLATWNVNSIRARLPRVLPWLEQHRPEVVCLQETKCLDEQFPREEIEALGYTIEPYGQKTYNGVAILARGALEDVVHGMPGDGPDAEARVIAATAGDTRVVDVYVINGREVGHPKYDEKLAFFGRLADYVRELLSEYDKLVITGDFNVAPDDRDVYDPERWKERILCSTPEREALAGVCTAGLTDALRHFSDEAGLYTWWDFRTRGFQRGNGLRIDHLLMSPAALDACSGVEIDTEARDGKGPSDHAPVVATFA